MHLIMHKYSSKKSRCEFQTERILKSITPGAEGVGDILPSLNVTFQRGDATETIDDVKIVLGPWPLRAPAFLDDGTLLNKKGFVPVNPLTNAVLHEDFANVFCIGDACWAFLEKPQQPHPKAGWFASQMGVDVTNQIGCLINKTEWPAPSRSGLCVAETGAKCGILVNGDLTEALIGGLPNFKFTPSEDGSGIKINWVNEVLDSFFDGAAFHPN
jgi:hypothetical protein